MDIDTRFHSLEQRLGALEAKLHDVQHEVSDILRLLAKADPVREEKKLRMALTAASQVSARLSEQRADLQKAALVHDRMMESLTKVMGVSFAALKLGDDVASRLQKEAELNGHPLLDFVREEDG